MVVLDCWEWLFQVVHDQTADSILSVRYPQPELISFIPEEYQLVEVEEIHKTSSSNESCLRGAGGEIILNLGIPLIPLWTWSMSSFLTWFLPCPVVW